MGARRGRQAQAHLDGCVAVGQGIQGGQVLVHCRNLAAIGEQARLLGKDGGEGGAGGGGAAAALELGQPLRPLPVLARIAVGRHAARADATAEQPKWVRGLKLARWLSPAGSCGRAHRELLSPWLCSAGALKPPAGSRPRATTLPGAPLPRGDWCRWSKASGERHVPHKHASGARRRSVPPQRAARNRRPTEAAALAARVTKRPLIVKSQSRLLDCNTRSAVHQYGGFTTLLNLLRSTPA